MTVGVYAGDLKTTTPAEIPCLISILCGEAEVADENIQEFRDIAQQAAAEAQQAATEAKKAATSVVHPTIDVEEIAGGHKLTIHDADGDESFNVMNGKNGGEDGKDGEDGEDGATFTPSVSSGGVISWTNNKGLTNPAPVNIKGGKGDKGDDGATFTPSVSSSGVLSWTNNKNLQNPSSINIKGGKGDPGLGISKIEINANGELVITYTNGDIINLGKVVGEGGSSGGGLTGEQLANFTEMWNWYSEQIYTPMTLTITPTGKTYELGSKNTFTLKWTFTQEVSSVTINGEGQTASAEGSKSITVEYKPTTPANGEFKYKVVGTRKDGKKESKDATCTINFHNRFYWGYATDPRTSVNDKLSNDFVRGLPTSGKEGSKGFSSGRANSFNITCDEGTYIWFAYPKRFGLATTSMAPRGSTMYFNGGFENPVEVSVTNDSKYTEPYYVYRSINPGISQAVKVT